MNNALENYIKIQIPNCPFHISNLENLEDINMLFTDLDLIFIKDIRATEDNEYYKELNNVEKQKYKHYLKILPVPNKVSITTMQVLKAMSKSPHYNNEFVKNDPCNNLIGFKQESIGERNKGDMYYPYLIYTPIFKL